MSKSSKSFKVSAFSLLVIALFISPFFFFNFQDSLETPSFDQETTDEKLYLIDKNTEGVEERDEDPRVMYMPDLEEGFATWLNQEIALPSLELPNMEIAEADFYLEEDFPKAQNSLSLNLESQIRAEWPLPDLQETLPELELKQASGELLIFVNEKPIENIYYDDEVLKLLFTDIEEEKLIQPSLLRIQVENDEMQVDLVHSCGVRKLENDFARLMLRQFYKDKVLSSITHKKGDRGGERSAFYLIEWRFAFSRLKNE